MIINFSDFDNDDDVVFKLTFSLVFYRKKITKLGKFNTHRGKRETNKMIKEQEKVVQVKSGQIDLIDLRLNFRLFSSLRPDN